MCDLDDLVLLFSPFLCAVQHSTCFLSFVPLFFFVEILRLITLARLQIIFSRHAISPAVPLVLVTRASKILNHMPRLTFH